MLRLDDRVSLAVDEKTNIKNHISIVQWLHALIQNAVSRLSQVSPANGLTLVTSFRRCAERFRRIVDIDINIAGVSMMMNDCRLHVACAWCFALPASCSFHHRKRTLHDG